jgi:hypothetical protein
VTTRADAPVETGPEPPRLRELQAFLAVALRREAPIPEDPAVAASASTHVSGNDRLTPSEQADLYREQFWLRHVASLAEDYPGLRALIGEEAFDALAHAYLSAHPPRTPSLRDLGAQLRAFAATWSGLEERRDAALEMLGYEQCFIDLFDGADAPPLDAKKLQSIGEDAWERARIALHPLLARMRLAWPVHMFRLSALSGDAPPPFPEPRAVCLVLYRRDNIIQYDELEPPAFALLDALGRGVPLGAACEQVAATLAPEDAEAFSAKVGAWFQDWTSKGWIVDVTV